MKIATIDLIELKEIEKIAELDCTCIPLEEDGRCRPCQAAHVFNEIKSFAQDKIREFYTQ